MAIPGWFVVVAGLGVGVFGVDTYYTVKAYGGKVSEESAKFSIGWTAWQPALLYPLALRMDRNAGPALAAAAAWPLALTAYGIARVDTESASGRGAALGLVGAADAILLGYDVVALTRGERVGKLYAIIETSVGVLQTGFAITSAVRADGDDRSLALALGVVPLTLVAHGMASLLLPVRPDRRPAYALTALSLPLLDATPVAGGAILRASGRW